MRETGADGEGSSGASASFPCSPVTLAAEALFEV